MNVCCIPPCPRKIFTFSTTLLGHSTGLHTTTHTFRPICFFLRDNYIYISFHDPIRHRISHSSISRGWTPNLDWVYETAYPDLEGEKKIVWSIRCGNPERDGSVFPNGVCTKVRGKGKNRWEPWNGQASDHDRTWLRPAFREARLSEVGEWSRGVRLSTLGRWRDRAWRFCRNPLSANCAELSYQGAKHKDAAGEDEDH